MKQVRDETVSVIEHSRIIFHSTLHSASSYALAERPSKASSGGISAAETVRAFNAAVQAMLWRNAPAKPAPAETVRAFNAAVPYGMAGRRGFS